MVALWNTTDHYIFILWFVLVLLSFFFFPRLISAVAEWMSAIRHDMSTLLTVQVKLRRLRCGGRGADVTVARFSVGVKPL